MFFKLLILYGVRLYTDQRSEPPVPQTHRFIATLVVKEQKMFQGIFFDLIL
ncbi:hypothetical protein KL86SPO_50211 [uncultured Sporomusa sp.]|uniref:Uncharacterized protein n=1 Tax=uncultured Sporomusa sp. TaxID=307249 RepID=A0A212LY80_9FIRM|nr:hypothetical protein KL86SPO_50211 [uncultured Sporomusa sp.]